MSTDFQHLLGIRDLHREICRDDRLDEIVVTRLRDKVLAALREAVDDLQKVDCARKPGLAARVDSELASLRAIVEVFSSGRDA